MDSLTSSSEASENKVLVIFISWFFSTGMCIYEYFVDAIR